jgi:hypothetical protein
MHSSPDLTFGMLRAGRRRGEKKCFGCCGGGEAWFNDFGASFVSQPNSPDIRAPRTITTP